MAVFKPISSQVFEVGKIIKSTKKRYSWKILLDELDYVVDFYYSKISSKIKILVNGELALDTKSTEHQQYKFNIRYRPLVIVRTGKDFDLRYGRISSEAVLSGKQEIEPERKSRLDATDKKIKTPKPPLRRSLPIALPKDIPSIQFRKNVQDIDLLDFKAESRNPFEEYEEAEQRKMFKTAGTKSSTVPWPSNNPFAFTNN